MAKVLVVDDEAVMLRLFTTVLTASGHQATAANRGDTAIEKLQAESFDLVISDVRMEPVDGFTLLARVKAARPATPVIMVTAYDSEDARQRARELGAFRYLRKPFGLQELVGAVNEAVQPPAANAAPA